MTKRLAGIRALVERTNFELQQCFVARVWTLAAPPNRLVSTSEYEIQEFAQSRPPVVSSADISSSYGPPLSLRYDPTMLPDATKQRDDMDKVADVILSLQGEKSGNIESNHSK